MAAARSLFTGFIRKHKNTDGLVKRFTSSVDLKPENGPEDEPYYSSGTNLRSRIYRLRLPKDSATNVIEKWVNEGNPIIIDDLRNISKELRSSNRFKHALELSEWMFSRGDFELSDKDYALRIDLMTKVFGIDAAERYFESLPPSAKTPETYTALLHCYATLKLTSKAEDLYERIKGSDLKFSAITYNELMTYYMSIGQIEKISSVVEELKTRNVFPDIYTYNLWISSCASALKIDDVRKILDEMAARESGSLESWVRYVKLVKIYLSAGQLVNSEVNSVVESGKAITPRESITYDLLIILHGALGNKERLDKIWKNLSFMNQKMISRNFICITSAYLMLGHYYKVNEVVGQWKKLATTDFDKSVSDRLLNAFREVGMNDKASTLHLLLSATRDP